MIIIDDVAAALRPSERVARLAELIKSALASRTAVSFPVIEVKK